MKKHIFFLLLLTAILTSCGPGNEAITSDAASSEPIFIETSTDSVLSQTTESKTGEEDPYLFESGERTEEKDGVTYLLKYPLGETERKEKDLISFSSERDTVRIVSQFTGTRIKQVYFEKVDIPNAVILSFAEGIEVLNTAPGTLRADALEEIHLPASLDHIYFDREPFPFPSLRAIYVSENSSSQSVSFQSHDGVLYQNNQLICVPRDHRPENGTLVIREGTYRLGTASIYHCRNITKVIIPDSVTRMYDRDIVATAEHPLTVVCSRGSAAAAYVERFGEQYHLTVEYTD